MSWALEERRVRVGRLGLNVLDARREGTDGGRTLLMLHGMGAHGDAWRPVLRDLQGVDRVLCPDHRGHGRSDWSRDGYWLRDYAADARGLLDELGIGEVGVVGHSLGARVAMVLAPQLDGRLTSLALLDTGPEVSRAAAQQALAQGTAKQTTPGYGSEEKLTAALRAEHPDFADEQIDIRARLLYRLNWADKLVLRGDPEVYWLLGRAGLAEVDDMWAGLRATKAPALVLRATKSFLLDAELGGRMVEALPQGRYTELELGHFMHYEDPALIARTLNAFRADLG
ncbi:alpha/beta fold hydrolase [Pseudonocardia ailaonensis]|uniref:Alpha/beta fold hydrolase n=1 Tax=Pseudonocardia ailaonensis TaxID=367279 RepID=A0ABN2NG49_9PSEU